MSRTNTPRGLVAVSGGSSWQSLLSVILTGMMKSPYVRLGYEDARLELPPREVQKALDAISYEEGRYAAFELKRDARTRTPLPAWTEPRPPDELLVLFGELVYFNPGITFLPPSAAIKKAQP